MEKIVTHHPFRTIELEYDREKPQPDWEKETLDNYFHMHDEVWRLKTMREECEPRLDRAIAQITELHRALPTFIQEVGVLEAVVGLREAVDGPQPEDEKSFSIDLHHFRKASNQLSDDLAELYHEITRCTEEHNAFLREFEAFDNWFEAFADGPMHEIYQRYEEISVDTVSLDRDHQAFLETWSPVIHAEREYFDRALSAFNDYADLIDITNDLSERVKILDEALHDFTERNKHGKSGTIKIQPRDEK
ncbi:hypothetical protein [Parapedobacter tibetensis]|uniref:hypothetical protein n=1 Tax=Parapedobacter tibetensis TaxID=2972951 RepID=UPI00214DBE1E|nr:hypothetical protein [Parapedobacter tibetensis]